MVSRNMGKHLSTNDYAFDRLCRRRKCLHNQAMQDLIKLLLADRQNWINLRNDKKRSGENL